MDPSSQPQRRLVLAIDMVRYSPRTNSQQYEAQQVFRRVVSDAAEHAGLDTANWISQSSGDGLLVILPAEVWEAVLLSRFVPNVDAALRQYNDGRRADLAVRLRMAIDHGPVHLDGANGFPSEAVVGVCRLVDSPVLKRTLAAFPDAAVGIILSEVIYRDIVAQRYEGLRPERFVEVRVAVPDKEFAAVAWVGVADEDVRAAGAVEDAPDEVIYEDPGPMGAATRGNIKVRDVHSGRGGQVVIGHNGRNLRGGTNR